MLVDAFDFDLPKRNVALRPATPRDAARLLEVSSDGPFDRAVGELADILRPGDVLVFNDTRVVPARLTGRRVGRGETEPIVEATLHRRKSDVLWTAFAKPGRRLAAGDTVEFGEDGDLKATVLAKDGEGGEIDLAFDREGAALDDAVARLGVMPLPPYIASRRPADDRDRTDYQTVYARRDGAVAAPTAGLHFTERLLERLDEAGVAREFVTLHVGAGTFLPVRARNTEDHRMHAEWGEIDPQVARRLNDRREAGGRLVAVGTTSLRLLESAAEEDGRIRPHSGHTDIFIVPGHRFRTADLLLTNFHLPRSTLFMLTCAFAGLDRMRRAYEHAIARDYRFHSYGDACLLHRAEPTR